MTMTRFARILCLAGMFAGTVLMASRADAQLADAPRVIWAEPDTGDTCVDPAITEMRIEFDQDMATNGFSLCGGGPTFPGTGMPKWTSPRVLVLPIKLEPGKTYSLGVNCPSAQKFKSTAGVVLEPYPIWFTTRAVDAPPLATIGDAERRAAIDQLKTYIAESYSHKDVRQVNWNSVYAALEERAKRATTCAALTRAIARALAPAKDIHLSVRNGTTVLPTHTAKYALNFDRKTIEHTVTDFQCDGTIVTGTYRGLPYVLIPSWTGSAKDHERAIAFVDAHADAPGMIIDVRPNTGGDERLARVFASRFTTQSTVYARHRIRTPGAPDGWAGPFDRTIEPDPDHPAKLHGKAVVLMGPANMSSNESFLHMMRTAGGAKLVGDTSYGSSGNPKPFDLGCGIMLMLPSWADMDVDGTPTEGHGIRPDVRVEWTPSSTVPDPVLERAADLVTGKPAAPAPATTPTTAPAKP